MKIKYYDAIILGSGISGLSVNYWLKKSQPKISTLILDNSDVMCGASSKNAGFLTVGSRAFYAQLTEKYDLPTSQKILDFCQKNHDLLYEENLLNANCSYLCEGSYSIFSEYSPIENAPGFVKTTSPYLKESETCYFYSLDGACDPEKLLKALASSAHNDILGNSEIYWPKRNSELLINGQTYRYGQIFITTNAWLNDLVDSPKVIPTRAQIFKSLPLKTNISGNYYFSDQKVYLRQLPDRRLLVGGMRVVDADKEQTDIEALNPVIQKQLLEFAQDRLSLQLDVEKSWSGIMGFTENQLPAAGVIDQYTYYMAGFSGHGMGMAFHLAKMLVEKSLNKNEIPAIFSKYP